MPGNPIRSVLRAARAGMETRSAFGAPAGFNGPDAGWLGGPDGGVDWKSRAGKLQANSTVCLALSAVLGKVRQTRLYAGKVGSDGTVTPTPTYDAALAFYRTGEGHVTESLLLAFGIASAVLFGTGYWIVNRDRVGRPLSLTPIASTSVKPKRDRHVDGTKNDGTELVTRYEITPIGGGKAIEKDVADVIPIHLGVPDMDNPGASISPVSLMLRQVATDNESTNFLASVLFNMGFPGVILSPKGGDGGDPSPGARARLKRLWNEFKGDGAGDVFASPVPIDVSTVHMTPHDLQVIGSKKLVMTELCAAVGPDPMAIGLPSETKTYANMKEAMNGLIENVVLPDCAAAASALEAFLRRPGGLWERVPADVHVLVDKSVFRELDEDVDAAHLRAERLFRAGGSTRGEYRGAIGLKGDLADPRLFQELVAAARPAASGAVAEKTGEKVDPEKDTRSSRSRAAERRRLELLHSRVDAEPDGQA